MSRANENKPPLPIEWVEEYGCKVPTCPACGDITDSVEQCPYCGQKFLPDDTVRERKKVSRMACLLCGTEHALVITRDAYNGHIRGVCEACGAKMMG